MDSTSSPPRYPSHGTEHRSPGRFPNPRDKAACARFRLARKRRTSASHSLPASGFTCERQLWHEMHSLRLYVHGMSALMVEETKIVSQLLRSFNEMIAATLPSFQQPQQDRPPSMATQTVDPVAKSDVIGNDQTPRPTRTGDLPPVAPAPTVPLPPPSFPNSSFVQGSESSSPSPHPGPQQFHSGPSVPWASDADPLPPPDSRPAQATGYVSARTESAKSVEEEMILWILRLLTRGISSLPSYGHFCTVSMPLGKN
ncbi:hypothetical protein R3P38DRAFT_2994834 [Favolaschia claudopus]|uniref:Uncharacterized protein n=1 Tax=Favolaschia claudopus TaxID=2862362 RepID=A0AAW0ARG5_9AGAR